MNSILQTRPDVNPIIVADELTLALEVCHGLVTQWLDERDPEPTPADQLVRLYVLDQLLDRAHILASTVAGAVYRSGGAS